MSHPNVKIVGPDAWDNADDLVQFRQVTTQASKFFVCVGSNTGAVDQWIFLFDSASTPAPGAKPKNAVKVLAGQWFSIDYAPYGRKMKNGIFIANSTSATGYTAGAADCFIDTGYRKELYDTP